MIVALFEYEREEPAKYEWVPRVFENSKVIAYECNGVLIGCSYDRWEIVLNAGIVCGGFESFDVARATVELAWLMKRKIAAVYPWVDDLSQVFPPPSR